MMALKIKVHTVQDARTRFRKLVRVPELRIRCFAAGGTWISRDGDFVFLSGSCVQVLAWAKDWARVIVDGEGCWIKPYTGGLFAIEIDEADEMKTEAQC